MLMSPKEIKKSVQIKSITKVRLDQLTSKFRDIKKLYFVDKAVNDAINLEYRLRELQNEDPK